MSAGSRLELADIGLEAIQENDVARYRSLLMTIPQLREHCTPQELDRASATLPRAIERLADAIRSCHSLTDWKRASLVSIQGGDVYERARECKGQYARISAVVATYVVDRERFEIHHRRAYLEGGESYLVSREPWCARH